MIEILLPLRNPTDALIRTVDSLLRQKNRNFTVLISDNHSSSGKSLIAKSRQRLAKGGVDVQHVRPPVELRKIEHWNWLHFQSQAAWLKPLFAGDELEPGGIATFLREIKKNPDCSFLYSPPLSPPQKKNRAASHFHLPGDLRQKILRDGRTFSPPGLVAYRRDAFFALGGYQTLMPIQADHHLFCSLAARFGAVEITPSVGRSHPQEIEPSPRLPEKAAAAFREKMTFLIALLYHASTEDVPLSRWGIFRRIALEAHHRMIERRDLAAR